MVNVKPVKQGSRERMSFSKINEVMEMPNLIEVQKDSYQWFLDKGLREVFRDIDEITDYSGNLSLVFVDYRMDDKPKYTVKECKERDATFAAPLRVTARLINKETGEVKENEVYMGDFPQMTESGTFVINGAERVIISQLVRSPGVYFDMSRDKTGKKLFATTVIPNRGAWLEYETDQNDVFYVRIDKTRKICITTFVRAMGSFLEDNILSTNSQIDEFFGYDDRIKATFEKDNTQNTAEALLEVYKKLRPVEQMLSQLPDGCGNHEALELLALLECIFANRFQSVIQQHALQVRAADEGALRDCTQAAWRFELGKRCVQKRKRANDLDRFG